MKALFQYIIFFLFLRCSLFAVETVEANKSIAYPNPIKNSKKIITSVKKESECSDLEKKDEMLSENEVKKEVKDESKVSVVKRRSIFPNPIKGSPKPIDSEKEEEKSPDPVDAKDVSVLVTDSSAEKNESELPLPELEKKAEELSKKEAIVHADTYNDCPTLDLTLEVLFNCIEAENLTVLLNRERIEEAFQVANIARADLLPQFSLSLTQNRSLTVGDFGSGDTSFTNSLFNGTINGSMVLFDLTRIAGYQEAKMGETITALNYNAILQGVLTDAATLYYQHIRNLRGLNVIEANLNQAQVLLDLAKTRFNAGVASPIDVTRAEVQVAIYERQRLDLHIAIKRSELNLKRMLDLDMHQKFEIPHVKLEQDPPAPEVTIPPVNAILLNRFDYLTENARLALNEFEEEAAFWDYFPKINLTGSWGYASPFPFQGQWLPEWSITLGLSMPLFDGFRIRSNIFREASRVRQQKDILLDLANTISTEITLNSYTLETRFAEIDLVRRQVILGEKELDLAKTRFAEGVADNTEVVNAQTKLAIFLDSLVEIVYAYDISRIEWARTQGDVRMLLCNKDAE